MYPVSTIYVVISLQSEKAEKSIERRVMCDAVASNNLFFLFQFVLFYNAFKVFALR